MCFAAAMGVMTTRSDNVKFDGVDADFDRVVTLHVYFVDVGDD